MKAGRRIEPATSGQVHSEILSNDAVDKSFATMLATQLIICEWLDEYWRYYVSFLEKEFQNMSRRALFTSMDETHEPLEEAANICDTVRLRRFVNNRQALTVPRALQRPILDFILLFTDLDQQFHLTTPKDSIKAFRLSLSILQNFLLPICTEFNPSRGS